VFLIYIEVISERRLLANVTTHRNFSAIFKYFGLYYGDYMYNVLVRSVSIVLSLILIVMFLNTYFGDASAQSANLLDSSENQTSQDFLIDYNYTNYVSCSPGCDINIRYDSSTNELSFIDRVSPKDVVVTHHLTEEQEKVLASWILPIEFADFDGSGFCQIGTIYCETSSIIVTKDGKSHSAVWSYLSEIIVDNLNNIDTLLQAIGQSNQTNAQNAENFKLGSVN
jgi:hypothetical protein